MYLNKRIYAKYQRVPRSQIPPNVIMKRRYRIRAAPKGRRRRPIRKGQRGRGFLSSLKTIAKNPPVRQIGKTVLGKAIDYTSQLHNLGTSKIKNKTARKTLQSDATTNLLKPCYKIRQQVMATGNWITNIEIENFFDDKTLWAFTRQIQQKNI